MSKVVLVEGVAYTGIEQLSIEIATELRSAHVDLLEEPYCGSMGGPAFLSAIVLSLRIAHSLDGDIVLRNSMPALYAAVKTGARLADYDPFALSAVDASVAKTDHLAVLIRHPDFSSWFAGFRAETEIDNDLAETRKARKAYEAWDSAYMEYINRSRLNWSIFDPHPPVERVLKAVERI